MKKTGKILLIIVLVAALILGGIWAYNYFFGAKFEKMDTEEGWGKYLEAREKSVAKEEFYLTYEKDDSNGEINGSATIDKFGFYHKWDGDYSGNEYAVNIGGGRYGYFTEENGTKNSANISASEYASSYGAIEKVNGLEFMASAVMVDSEDYIRSAYSGFNIVNEEGFEHEFGTLKGRIIWRTTYKCTYEYDNAKYAGEYVREVSFDTEIREVSVKINDKEVNAEGKAVRKGKKRSVEIEHNIEYKTNQSLIKVDFSEYPSIS